MPTNDVAGILVRLDLAIGAGEWTGNYNTDILRDARTLIQQQAETVAALDDIQRGNAQAAGAWADRAMKAEASIASLTEERDRLTALHEHVACVLHDRTDDLTKEACDECEQCGKIAMCAYHSLLSELAKHVGTTAGEIVRRLTAQLAEAREKIDRTESALWKESEHRNTVVERLAEKERELAEARRAILAVAKERDEYRDGTDGKIAEARHDWSIATARLVEAESSLTALRGEHERVRKQVDDYLLWVERGYERECTATNRGYPRVVREIREKLTALLTPAQEKANG